MSSFTTLVLNLVIPGSGLIVRRREWLGFSLAMLFGICGNVGLASWLIAPEALPPWLTVVAFFMAGLTWLLAQILFLRQCRHLAHCESGIRVLLEESRTSIESGDLDAARSALEAAATLDEEHVEVNVHWARLFERAGNEGEARSRWRRVIELDHHRDYQSEASAALSRAQAHARGSGTELSR